MSTIAHPIMLDSTGQQIVGELSRQNAYLAMIAAGHRKEVYSSMSQIASIVRSNTVEQNSILFQIGDQIIAPWKDMDDPAHNTDETSYQVPWDIVHHGLVELQSGDIVPGMYIQMHKCSAYNVQFSNRQAFKNCPDGLPAGTYHVTFGGTWGQATNGTSWQFTLTQPVPGGGKLSGFESVYDAQASTYKVKSWAKPTDADPIETVAVTEGTGGSSLGTMLVSKVSDDKLNSIQATSYGHNRWSTSAIRQYLNASGKNWLRILEDFDIRPNEYTKSGFMSGFDDDFLNAIKPVKVTTALNTVEGFDTATEDTFDTFFLPSLEQMYIKPQIAGAEGDYFEYWKQRSGMASPAPWYTNMDQYKHYPINGAYSQDVRLRSADRGGANNAWFVNSSGFVTSCGTYYALRFSPVCVIC